MIHVFYNKRGSGKTKALINLANEKVLSSRGHVVFIDDDSRHLFDLHRNVRFISTNDYKMKDYNCFYGFLCGILAEDYDIETVYIDGLSNIVRGNLSNAAHLFFELEKLSVESNVEFYINVNSEDEELPEFIKKYVA